MVEAVVVAMFGGVATKSAGWIRGDIEAGVSDPTVAPRLKDCNADRGR